MLFGLENKWSIKPLYLLEFKLHINPISDYSLPESFFVICLPRRGGYYPSLDFCYKASDSYDFGTGG